jgi:Na+-transporting NADH:ubiquinone oxidoreductase subunit NqrC
MNQMKKTTDQFFPARTGGAIIIVVVLLLVAGIIGAGVIYSQGNQQQQRQSQLLADGYELFNQGKLAEAYPLFKEAQTTFSSALNFYRRLASSESHVTPDELHELIVSVCLSIAHEQFFDLKTADEWVSRAEEDLKHLPAGERKSDLTNSLVTARDVSKLCETFNAGNYEQAMKDLLAAEANAQASDQDFFIFEIRFLIACGKALGEPAIINQARELLFFATTDAGIDNEKTRSLWVTLTN